MAATRTPQARAIPRPCVCCGEVAVRMRWGMCKHCYRAAYYKWRWLYCVKLSSEWQRQNRVRRNRQLRGSPIYREQSRRAQAKRRVLMRASGGKGISPEQWRALLQAYSHRCVYCGVGGKMTKDHVEPISRGGLHVPSNIVPACPTCNSVKKGRPAPVLPAVRLMI